MFKFLRFPGSNYISSALIFVAWHLSCHYNDVIMSTIASQITSLTIVYSTVYSGADQIKHQSSETSPGTGEFPTQMASYAENVSIWWRHHVLNFLEICTDCPPMYTLGQQFSDFSSTCQIFKLIFWHFYKYLAYCNVSGCMQFIHVFNFSVNPLRFSGHRAWMGKCDIHFEKWLGTTHSKIGG